MQTSHSIRVLIALDGLAAELVERQLRSEADFEVVGRARGAALLDEARRMQPDFVVLPLAAGGTPCDPSGLFDVVRKVKVLTLEKIGGRAFLSELIGDVSPGELADVLHRAAAREAL